VRTSFALQVQNRRTRSALWRQSPSRAGTSASLTCRDGDRRSGPQIAVPGSRSGSSHANPEADASGASRLDDVAVWRTARRWPIASEISRDCVGRAQGTMRPYCSSADELHAARTERVPGAGRKSRRSAPLQWPRTQTRVPCWCASGFPQPRPRPIPPAGLRGFARACRRHIVLPCSLAPSATRRG